MNFIKLSISLIFCFLAFEIAYSQEKLEIVIKDNLEKPIRYTSVIWGKTKGLVSDSLGYLQILDKNEIDSLIITAIGYKKQILTNEHIITNTRLEVKMQNEQIELPEVIIAKYSVENVLGCTEKKNNSYFKNAFCSNLQGALLVSSYRYPAQCKSISVFIAKQSSTDIPYRLRLYEIANDRLPGKDLLLENLIVKDYKTNSWNTYELDSIPVQLPENGFFAAIEWLCTDIRSENGLCAGLTSKMDKPITYYKSGNVGWFQPKYNGGVHKFNLMIKVNTVSVK